MMFRFTGHSSKMPPSLAQLSSTILSGGALMKNFSTMHWPPKSGCRIPKTVILPSRELPDDTSAESFSNLAYPLDWKGIFDYVGFPAYMKPFAGGGWKNVYRLNDMNEFFERHAETGQLVMLLQEEIVFRGILPLLLHWQEACPSSCPTSPAIPTIFAMWPISNPQPRC